MSRVPAVSQGSAMSTFTQGAESSTMVPWHSKPSRSAWQKSELSVSVTSVASLQLPPSQTGVVTTRVRLPVQSESPV